MKAHTNNRLREARPYYKSGIATRVYAATNSYRFHADRDCPELADVETVLRFPLGWVVTHRSNPTHPCDYCTQDVPTTAEVAVTYDQINPDELVEPYEESL